MKFFLLALALFTVSPPLRAEHVTISVKAAPLVQFLDMVSAQTKVTFILGDGIPDQRISAELKNATLLQALTHLTQIKGVCYHEIAPDLYLVGSESMSFTGAAALAGYAVFDTTLTVNASQAPLQGIFDQIGENTKTRFTLAEGLEDSRATVLLKNVSARQAVQVLCAIKGLTVNITGSGSFIVKPAAAVFPAPTETQAKEAVLKPDEAGLYSGYRGVSLPVPGHQLAFLKKGDRVDVLVTFEAKMADKHKEKVTATILQNVVVVDVQKPAKIEDRGTVQIELNPNEAQYAALSEAQGEINIVLRAPGDVEMHPMEMASFRKLFR